MSLLVAIEGADGAGKATAARGLAELLVARGRTAEIISFPRYTATVGGVALGEFLSGRMPVPVTPEAAAVLYALDRLESRAFIADTAARNDFVIFDRYIGSNIAYQAAKVAPGEVAAMMDWIARLETESFALPPPGLSIYLDTPQETSHRLMLLKQRRVYTEQEYDEHEADAQLQRRVRDNYGAMAAGNVLGPWKTVRTAANGNLRAPDDISVEILEHVLAFAL